MILATLDKVRSMGLDAVPALLGLATGKVAKKLVEEAVEVAIKMALQAQAQRGHPRRTRFAALIAAATAHVRAAKEKAE